MMNRTDIHWTRSHLRILAPLFAALMLQACATMDEGECRTADWRVVGYEDGVAGRSAARIGKYRESCADHGVKPDMVAYREGREQGLREYCRPQNGYRVGRQGHSYYGVCPKDLDEEFTTAYYAGRQIYDLESSIRSTESRLRYKEQELSEIKQGIRSRAVELVKQDTTSNRRIELLFETSELTKQKGTVEGQISQLQAKAARDREELASLKHDSHYR